MTEGKMIQMIPEYPETPLLQQKWRAGFCIFTVGGEGDPTTGAHSHKGGQKARLLWRLADVTQYVVNF
jgi:hypothetical protein